MTSSPIPGRVSHPKFIAGLCDFTQVETIYEQHLRTLHIQTARFKRNPAITRRLSPVPLADVVPIAEAIYADLDDDQEHFTILTCDHAQQVYGFKVIAKGYFHTVDVPYDALVRAALLLGARGIVLLHNHPSGNLQPSPADVRLTQRLITMTRMLGIDILDHIIFSPDTGAISMRPMYPDMWPDSAAPHELHT